MAELNEESLDVEQLMAEESFPLNIPDSLARWMEDPDHKEVNILLTGKPGTGRSALINGLVGKTVAKESERLDQETRQLSSYVINKRGVSFKIWDTPGLQTDPHQRDEEIRRLNSIADVRTVDLVLYCTRMDDSRIRKEDIDTISYFTEAFGEAIWEHAVFVLTFANTVLPSRDQSPDNTREYFSQKLKKWKIDLTEALKNSGVPSMTTDSIPVVPVGYYSQPELPDGRENWLSAFWFICLDTMKNKAKPAMLHVNVDRLKLPEEVSGDDFERDISEQPLIFNRIPTRVVVPAGGVLGAAAGGLVFGGVLGMGVGAALGTMSGFALYSRLTSKK